MRNVEKDFIILVLLIDCDVVQTTALLPLSRIHFHARLDSG